MTPEQKEKLLHLKAKQQQKIKDAEVEMTKKRIIDNIHDFSAKYRFALPDETHKITTLINNLPYSQPGKIDFSLLPASTLTQHNTIWICFLAGTEELLNIFVLGNFSDFINDYDDWFFISPYMLLVDKDMSRFVFVDDKMRMTESNL